MNRFHRWYCRTGNWRHTGFTRVDVEVAKGSFRFRATVPANGHRDRMTAA